MSPSNLQISPRLDEALKCDYRENKRAKNPNHKPPKNTSILYKPSLHTHLHSHKRPQRKPTKNSTTVCNYSGISHHLSIFVSCSKILHISYLLNSAMVTPQRAYYIHNTYTLFITLLAHFQELQNPSKIKLVQLQLKVRNQLPCHSSYLTSIKSGKGSCSQCLVLNHWRPSRSTSQTHVPSCVTHDTHGFKRRLVLPHKRDARFPNVCVINLRWKHLEK